MPSANVLCPTGKVALSGGAHIDASFAGTLVLRSSAPLLSSGSAIGWFAIVTTTSGANISATWNATLTVYALCANVSQ
ncbi:MAG: hypothetical protein AUH85_07770 [Chloroflexi bacterium 13_1_40CM_4_68_4]|nr:MAG: hypothetical protein AUH85_07770 [Chloroflexi bacterium 13_1_40CM_4_68_4]